MKKPQTGNRKSNNMKPQDFFTRQRSNEGERMYIIDPLTGIKSNEYLIVRGFDSDEFNAALVDKRRENARILSLPQEEQKEASEAAELVLIASTVGGWSFDADYTLEALLELLREAPSVCTEIDKFSSNRANFINPR